MIDKAGQQLENVLLAYGNMLKEEKVDPLPDGSQWWSKAIRQIMAEGGATSEILKAQSAAKAGVDMVKKELPRVAVPDEEEFPIADLVNLVSQKLHSHPAWRNKLLKYLLDEFDADAGHVVGVAEVAELHFYMSEPELDEEWEHQSKSSEAKGSAAKAKPGWAKKVYSPQGPWALFRGSREDGCGQVTFDNLTDAKASGCAT